MTSIMVCPGCGHRKEFAKVPRRKFICGNCGSGHPRVIRRIKWWMRTSDGAVIDQLQAQRATLAGLLWFVQIKGYKPGWAAVKFKALFGIWPPRDMIVEPASPSEELTRWVTRQQALFSAARRAGRKMQEAQAEVRV